MKKKEQILTVGMLVMDTINGESKIGGEAANVAWNISQLGLPTALLSILGSDIASENIQSYVRQSGIQLIPLGNAIPRLPECHIFMGEDGKETGYDWFGNGVEEAFISAQVPIEICDRYTILYLGAVEPVYAQRLVKEIVGRQIIYNPGTRIFENPGAFMSIHEVSTLTFLNRAEADFILEHYELESYEKLQAYEKQTIVITAGRDGAYLLSDKGMQKHDAFPVDAVDETGAGDAFASATIWAINQGYSIQSAVQAGMLLASLVVQQYGAQITPQIQRDFLQNFQMSVDQS